MWLGRGGWRGKVAAAGLQQLRAIEAFRAGDVKKKEEEAWWGSLR